MHDAHLGKKRARHTEETKRKISIANKGKLRSHEKGVMKHSEESKLKISLAQRGKKLSESHKKKISVSNTLKGPKVYAKIADRLRGRRHTEEARKKISESKKGNSAFRGKKHSEETRRKMSASASRRIMPPQSDEQKRKLSESMKAYWARWRASTGLST